MKEGIDQTIQSKHHSSSIGSEALPDLLQHLYNRVCENATRSKELSGIPTGFKEFDNFSYGMQGSDLIVVGAETSQGKTAFTLDVLYNAAQEGYKGLFCTLEMSSLQLTSRLVAKKAGLSAKEILMGRNDDYCRKAIKDAMNQIIHLPIHVFDKMNTDFIKMFGDIAQEVKRLGADFVVIDYLQLMRNSKNLSTADKFAEMANYAKSFAKKFNIPIILVSQLKRATDSKRPVPTIDRLKQSGDIENAADIILLLWRPETYGIPSIEIPTTGEKFPSGGVANLIVAKGRNIGTAHFLLKFNESTTTFSNYETIPEEQDDLPL